MFKVNEDYLKLPGSYLFSTIGKKVAAFQEANPDKSIIRLGIGDVTQPLAPAIIESLHSAVDEMAHAETFRGYAPDLGYEFLRSAMAKNDYQDRGCEIHADEIFISDGAKCDSGNIQELFAKDNKIAVDATYGRRTRAVVIMDSGHIILSAVQPETVAGRLEKDDKEEIEE